MDWKIRGSFLDMTENVSVNTESTLIYSQYHILSDKPCPKTTKSQCPAFICVCANVKKARSFPVLRHAVLRMGLNLYVEVN